MNAPKFGGLMKVVGENHLDDLPDVEHPYYIGASDGLFLHRRLLIGRGVVKQSHWPENWPKMGTHTGIFRFDAPPIPGEMMSKVVSFFRRIYRKMHAEAMVLLTFNMETREWGAFIPTQLVSHGGINYVYDPQHVRHPWYVVGSIHSHCDFSPFHSGTDTGDADEFDGLHMTTGYIEKDEPGIVAMMAMNKTKMHYQKDQFPELFDFTQLWQHEAPEWWDNYVGTNTEHPVGYELYKKFEKPTIVKDEKKVAVYNPQTQTMGKGPHGNRAVVPYDAQAAHARQMMSDWGIAGWNRSSEDEYAALRRKEWMEQQGYKYDENLKTWRWAGSAISKESATFNARKAAERGVHWTKEGHLVTDEDNIADAYAKLFDSIGAEENDEEYFEDALRRELGDVIVDFMFDEDLITDDDISWAVFHPKECSTPEFWRELFFGRVIQMTKVLRLLGMTIDINVKVHNTKSNKVESYLLPNDTKTDMKGLI